MASPYRSLDHAFSQDDRRSSRYSSRTRTHTRSCSNGRVAMYRARQCGTIQPAAVTGIATESDSDDQTETYVQNSHQVRPAVSSNTSISRSSPVRMPNSASMDVYRYRRGVEAARRMSRSRSQSRHSSRPSLSSNSGPAQAMLQLPQEPMPSLSPQSSQLAHQMVYNTRPVQRESAYESATRPYQAMQRSPSVRSAIPYLSTPDMANITIQKSSIFNCSDTQSEDLKFRKNGPVTRRLSKLGRKFEDFKRLPQKMRNGETKREARAYLLQVLRRLLVMIIFVFLISLLLIPFHETSELHETDFKALKFDWQTNPRDRLSPVDPAFGSFNVLLDSHAHTTVSDGKLTPEQLVEYAIAQGYNAMIVTDHNTVDGGLRAEEYANTHHPGRFIVIPGMEYSSCRIHMNFINVNVTVTEGNKAQPTDEDIRTAIARAHELGGLVIVNHIPWSNTTIGTFKTPRLPNHPSIESLIDWGVDGFEVVNQATFDLPTFQHLQSLNNSGQPKMIMMTGSDIHSPEPAYAWTILNARQFTKESIMREIQAGRTSFLFDPTGSTGRADHVYSSKYLALAPLSELADYFGSFYDRYTGQYSFHGSHCQNEIVEVHGLSIGCFMMYFVAALVLFEIILKLFRVVERKIQRRRSHTAWDDSVL